MGDMADWINDQYNEIYEYGGEKFCRYCDKDGLQWVNVGSEGKPIWRLADHEGVHVCDKYKKQTRRNSQKGELE